jgi:hypothetical protein
VRRTRDPPRQWQRALQGSIFQPDRDHTLDFQLPQSGMSAVLRETIHRGTLPEYHVKMVFENTPGESALLGCAVGGGILESEYRVRLWAFLALDDVELNIIALFQRFVAIQLNRGVVNEHIRPVIAADESVALGVVKPLDLPFVLSHRLLLSLGLAGIRRTRGSYTDTI